MGKYKNILKKLSILIPAYNEESTILLLIKKVTSQKLPNGIEKEIIIVDDCSNDNTYKIVSDFKTKINKDVDLKIFKHDINKGKGAALQTAIKHATGDFILIQDADLEYSPSNYPNLIKPIIKNGADVVYGSRLLTGKSHRVIYYWHSLGNKFLTFLSNVFTNINLTDMETCYKVIKRKYFDSIKIQEKRFGIEPEITAKLSKIPNIKFYEVGISYEGRSYKEGKKITWKDGVSAIYCIIKYNLFH